MQLPHDISLPTHCKGTSGLEMNGKDINAQNPLQSLTATLSPNLNIDDSANPCQAKQHLHCTNYAFKDWSGTKETQKTYFFSASYYEDH